MRYLKTIILVFISVFGSIGLLADNAAESLQEAIQLSKKKKYPEALEKYLSFYSMKDSGSQPVWLSFGIAWWGKMANEYEPAREKLLAIRDQGIRELKKGENSSEGGIQEIFMINRAMRDAESTATLFEYLDRHREQQARQAWDFGILAKPLAEAGEYALAAKYMDSPADELSEMLLEYQRILNNSPRAGMEKTWAAVFEYKALILVDICMGADKENSNHALASQLGNAIKILEKNPEAQKLSGVQYFIGVCYDYGYGVVKDQKNAVIWYRKAAEQGNANAQNGLGYAYQYEEGVKQDYAEAFKWYKLAAEQGNANAQNNLGYSYEHEKGVKQDYAEAFKWYKLAAEQGHADAQTSLAYCYLEGLGIKQDLSEAVKWYKLAAEQGNETAIQKLAELNKK